MRCFITLLMMLLSVVIHAQNISVESFVLDEMDLTANQQGTIVMDQNGEKCALIKIRTTETGFIVDVGSLGVTKTINKTAELWVYVPRGIRRISLAHQKYGMGKYDIPIPIEKAKTYLMELKLSIPKPSDSQILHVNISPINAILTLDDEMVDCFNGEASITLKIGKHKYCAVAPGYYQQEGSIDVTNDHEARLSLELDINPKSKDKVKQEDLKEPYEPAIDEKPQSKEFESIFSDLLGLYSIKCGETTIGEVMSFNKGKKEKQWGIERRVLSDGATIMGNADTDKSFIITIPTSKVSKKHNLPFSGLNWDSSMEDWKAYLINRGIKIDSSSEYGFSTIVYYTEKYKYMLYFQAKTHFNKEELQLSVVSLDLEK